MEQTRSSEQPDDWKADMLAAWEAGELEYKPNGDTRTKWAPYGVISKSEPKFCYDRECYRRRPKDEAPWLKPGRHALADCPGLDLSKLPDGAILHTAASGDYVKGEKPECAKHRTDHAPVVGRSGDSWQDWEVNGEVQRDVWRDEQTCADYRVVAFTIPAPVEAPWYPPRIEGYSEWLEHKPGDPLPHVRAAQVLYHEERKAQEYEEYVWSTWLDEISSEFVAYCVKLEAEAPIPALEFGRGITPIESSEAQPAHASGYCNLVELESVCIFGTCSPAIRIHAWLYKASGALVIKGNTRFENSSDRPYLAIDDLSKATREVIVEDTITVVDPNGEAGELPPGHYTVPEFNQRVERLARRSIVNWRL